MPATATTIERITGKLSDQPLLFQYTIKLVLLVAFLELILYRLVSRLGMHFSKLAADHQWIIPTFTALTEVGQWLLNVVAILLFLGLTVGMANRLAARGFTGLTRFIVPCIALLLLLTIGFLFVPPSMLGSAIYNTVALVGDRAADERISVDASRPVTPAPWPHVSLGHRRVALLPDRLHLLQFLRDRGRAADGVRIAPGR